MERFLGYPGKTSVHLWLYVMMIDEENKVRRYILEFSDKTEELVAEYELSSFDLSKFQN